jgi:hypothetical protein
MGIALKTVLELVGPLDDAPGAGTARERFRNYLRTQVDEPGQLRDYMQECLAAKGPQYSRALQDLVNRAGELLGFDVDYGLYTGGPGKIAFDGFWKSLSENTYVVVEVKTSEDYPTEIHKLVGRVDRLIAQGAIPSWEEAFGLFVVGRPNPRTKEIARAIRGERRTQQLRVIDIDALLSLVELKTDHNVSHPDILHFLRPAEPDMSPLVDLIMTLVSETQAEGSAGLRTDMATGSLVGTASVTAQPRAGARYWITPVKCDDEASTLQRIKALLSRRVYAFRDTARARAQISAGDWICFYAAGTGVVAHAQVKRAAERSGHPVIAGLEEFPWIIELDNVHEYYDRPVVLDEKLRSRLEAFTGKAGRSWGWFVQTTGPVSARDFALLTRSQPAGGST